MTAGEDSPSGYSWDDETGLLSAMNNSGRTRRILTEVAAAIQESVRLGASLEFTAAAEWLDGRPPEPPATRSFSPPPPAANRPGFSSAHAAAPRPSNARLTLRSGTHALASTAVAMPASRSFRPSWQTGKNFYARITATGAGFQVRVNLDIPEAPDFASLNPDPAQAVKNTPACGFIVPGPQWSRLDYPVVDSRRVSKKLSLFIKVTRAIIPDE